MISFYPGPSRVYDEVPGYVKDAHKLGVLSMSHRSNAFMELYKNTVALLQNRLKVPKGYGVFFASSATECWEMIAQSIIKEKSIHFYNGSFGEKWHEYTKRLKPNAEGISFDREQQLDIAKITFAGDVICLTQNETSNGTQLSVKLIKEIQKSNPDKLIAVDATSSMAGVALDFTAADIWFASVQKCFGLPAGLAVLICSPRALERVQQLNERNHFNSMTLLYNMMQKWQTSCTPNVLGIYLLMRTLKNTAPIRQTEKMVKDRFEAWVDFFENKTELKLLIGNQQVRSFTVLPIVGAEVYLQRLKKQAFKNGFLLGEGYGSLKENTFRIANFPAIQSQEVKKLMRFIDSFR